MLGALALSQFMTPYRIRQVSVRLAMPPAILRVPGLDAQPVRVLPWRFRMHPYNPLPPRQKSCGPARLGRPVHPALRRRVGTVTSVIAHGASAARSADRRRTVADESGARWAPTSVCINSVEIETAPAGGRHPASSCGADGVTRSPSRGRAPPCTSRCVVPCDGHARAAPSPNVLIRGSHIERFLRAAPPNGLLEPGAALGSRSITRTSGFVGAGSARYGCSSMAGSHYRASPALMRKVSSFGGLIVVLVATQRPVPGHCP
jgi:hypothetical protein